MDEARSEAMDSSGDASDAGPRHSALARRLAGLNVYLVGMMGAGKSAVGRPLATALGYRFVDADAVLEQVAGRTIAEIFASEGEEGFRKLETAVLDRIAGWHSLVVATGGGVVSRSVNWGHLQQGVVVWLDAPEAVLLERLQADPTPRPLMEAPDPAERLRALLTQRRPLYGQADLRVVQGPQELPERVAQRVLEGLPLILKERPAVPERPALLMHMDGRCAEGLN